MWWEMGFIKTIPIFPAEIPYFLVVTGKIFLFRPETNIFTEVIHNMARKVQFVETVLRDANQSLIATRLPFEKFEPMLETIDKAGYYAAECWGGATFDVCLRYLNEDPWERLRKIRAKMPNTSCRCCCVVRTFWATPTTPMISLSCS